jgi:hypothetical protein
MNILRNTVSPRHIANLCGEPFTAADVVNVATELGLERGFGMYERHEARQVIAKLIVRTTDPEIVERLGDAYKRLADEPEGQSEREPYG